MALILNGTSADDWIDGGEYSADQIDGLTGDDTLVGFSGDDLLIGNMGDDLLAAGDGHDSGIGGSGNDKIWMGSGSDFADGGPGADLIGGGAGFDRLWGDNGWHPREVWGWEIVSAPWDDPRAQMVRDMSEKLGLIGEYERDASSHDTIWGGADLDVILGGLGDDIIGGGTGRDYLSGGRGDDTVFGADGDDKVLGNDGDDLIFGGSGNDTLFDGGGTDTIWDGAGDDKMYAGNVEGFGTYLAGKGDRALPALDWDQDECVDNDTDTFAFAGCHGMDTIVGFDAQKNYQTEEDLIDLTAFGYNSGDDFSVTYYDRGESHWQYFETEYDVFVLYEYNDIDGVAYIESPSCCDCGATSENGIYVAYVGEFDSSNILI